MGKEGVGVCGCLRHQLASSEADQPVVCDAFHLSDPNAETSTFMESHNPMVHYEGVEVPMLVVNR